MSGGLVKKACSRAAENRRHPSDDDCGGPGVRPHVLKENGEVSPGSAAVDCPGVDPDHEVVVALDDPHDGVVVLPGRLVDVRRVDGDDL